MPLIVGLCCGLPLLWLIAQTLRHPAALEGLLRLDPFHLRLLARTLAYNGGVAVLATLLALPAAAVVGRGRGWAAIVLAFALPVSLLMPSIAYAYGWSQFLRLTSPTMGETLSRLLSGTWLDAAGLDIQQITNGSGGSDRLLHFVPAGRADVARCIWTLAAWLWPLPAGVIGLAMRRLDVNLQQQALLDGVLWRVTWRQLAGPVLASMACVMVLATQEFAVYEPTGISVVATEVRIVFETGKYSSPDNPITAPMGAAADPSAAADRGESDRQAARAAAAVVTAVPLLAVIFVLALLALWGLGKFADPDDVDVGPWPRALDVGAVPTVLALSVLVVTLAVPTASMVLSIHTRVDPVVIWKTFEPEIRGSLLLAHLAGLVALGLAFGGAVGGAVGGGRGGVRGGALVLSLVTFLVGGQMLAIALIRLYNRPWLSWVYQGPPIVVMAYVARFGWLALLAAAGTRTRPWRQVRDLAALDGASDARAAVRVVWPLAWPTLGAAAVLVVILSLTEVPATVLISPVQPRPLVPLLMTWVHMLRYDDMLTGSLLLMAVVLILAVAAVSLAWLGRGVWKRGLRVENRGWRKAQLSILYPLSSILVFSIPGCGGDADEPDEIWLGTGNGPGQVVYPRAITYSKADDTFYVVDRLARVQHIDRKGNYLNEWQMPQWQTGKPVGVSAAPDGNVYVPDTHYQRVIVYSPKGELLRQWGGPGNGPGQFIYPTDIAFDSKGRVFVSEYGDNDRVQVFTPEGRYLYAFGRFGQGDGELSRPQSMVIDPADDTVYIADACNHRIGVFKTDGTFVRNMGSIGSDLGQFRYPYGLDIDGDGSLIVCEFGNNRVQKIDKRTGRGLRAWGTPGRDPGQLAYPWAVAVDKRDRVVAVDAGNNRLQVFEF